MRLLKWTPVKTVMLVMTTLLLMYNNCAPKYDFGLTEEASLAAQGMYNFNTSFSTSSTSQQPVDLIWIIDNSGSMSNEAAHVRNNFVAFANSLEASTDFKLALISQSGSAGTQVSLPKNGANYLQVEQTVSSTNALQLAAKTICPAGRRCGSITGTGELSSFLRPNSKKIFIVVTDDQSYITGDDFMTAFSSVYPEHQAVLFGFVGQTAPAVSSCSISKLGSVYIDLAERTGGTTYDICAGDWTSTFKGLTDAVIAISRNTLTLPTSNGPIDAIVSVTLNGVELRESDYSFDGSVLTIKKDLLKNLPIAYVNVLYRVKKEAE